jgi:hypothetical protein
LVILGVVAAPLQAENNPGLPKLFIEPSATKTSMAKCELTVGTLECKEESLSGSYVIKVTPFAFKNDRGSLSLAISPENVKKLALGQTVEFTGLATSARDGKTKAIKGQTQPKAGGHGAVSFVVTTEDGDLLFNSTYKVVEEKSVSTAAK